MELINNDKESSKEIGGAVVLAVSIILVIAGGIFVWQKQSKIPPAQEVINDSKEIFVDIGVPTEDPKSEPELLTYLGDLGKVYVSTDLSKDWPVYRNEELGFEIKYPNDWSLSLATGEMEKHGVAIRLLFPSALESPVIDQLPPSSVSYSGVLISYWPDINSEYAKGGSWVGEWEYANLADFFTDPHASKQKVSKISLNDQAAYEVGIGGIGLNYGVMLEHNGVYELYFGAYDRSQLTDVEKEIISTFKLFER